MSQEPHRKNGHAIPVIPARSSEDFAYIAAEYASKSDAILSASTRTADQLAAVAGSVADLSGRIALLEGRISALMKTVAATEIKLAKLLRLGVAPESGRPAGSGVIGVEKGADAE